MYSGNVIIHLLGTRFSVFSMLSRTADARVCMFLPLS